MQRRARSHCSTAFDARRVMPLFAGRVWCKIGTMTRWSKDRPLTLKQEKFARHYVETGNQAEAYKLAGYAHENMKQNTLYRTAHDLFKHPLVSARIEEIMEEHAERHRLTVDDLISELEEARGMARECEQTSTMVSATMGKAKLLGLDKQEGGKEPPGPIEVVIKRARPKREDDD